MSSDAVVGQNTTVVQQIADTLERLEGRLGTVTATLEDQRWQLAQHSVVDEAVKSLRVEHVQMQQLQQVLQQSLKAVAGSCFDLKAALPPKKVVGDEPEEELLYTEEELEAALHQQQENRVECDRLNEPHNHDTVGATWTETIVAEEVPL
jgi:hypothetical protein